MNRRSVIGVGCLMAITLVAYIPAMRGGFVWDDDDYVVDNQKLRTPAGLYEIWTDPAATPQYYPLVHSSFWIEYQLWGLNSTGYHVVNVLIHALNSILLWRLLRRLSVPFSWVCALIFAVHPVHVESVAWITERKNVLSGFFYLSAALCFLRYWDFTQPRDDAPKRRGWYLGSLLCFAAALLSKTVAATLPAAILLMIWWKRGRIRAGNVFALAPMFVLGVSMGLVTVWLEKHQVGASGVDWELSFVDRCLIAGRALWFYAAKLIWPVPLTFNYPRWQIDSSQTWQYFFPVAVVLVLISLWTMRDRIGRGPLAAVLFFCGTLFPALGFFDVYPMRFSYVADHFQYLASIGIIAIVVAAIGKLMSRLSVPRPGTQIFSVVIVISILLVLTWRQGAVYEGLETLWRDTLAKNSSSFLAHNNLGALLNRRGDYVEAEMHLRDAVRIKPDFVDSVVNLAKAREGQGDFDEAIDLYRQATELDPKFAPGFNGLGAMYGVKGNPQLAEHFLTIALRLDPKYAKAHSNLATLYAGQQNYDAAVAKYLTAIELDPELIEARLNLARVFMAKQDEDAAERLFKEILDRSGDNISALLNLGVIAANQRRYQTAIHYFERVLRIDSTHVAATYNLAAMYDSIGDQTQAMRYRNAYERMTGEPDPAVSQ